MLKHAILLALMLGALGPLTSCTPHEAHAQGRRAPLLLTIVEVDRPDPSDSYERMASLVRDSPNIRFMPQETFWAQAGMRGPTFARLTTNQRRALMTRVGVESIMILRMSPKRADMTVIGPLGDVLSRPSTRVSEGTLSSSGSRRLLSQGFRDVAPEVLSWRRRTREPPRKFKDNPPPPKLIAKAPEKPEPAPPKVPDPTPEPPKEPAKPAEAKEPTPPPKVDPPPKEEPAVAAAPKEEDPPAAPAAEPEEPPKEEPASDANADYFGEDKDPEEPPEVGPKEEPDGEDPEDPEDEEPQDEEPEDEEPDGEPKGLDDDLAKQVQGNASRRVKKAPPKPKPSKFSRFDVRLGFASNSYENSFVFTDTSQVAVTDQLMGIRGNVAWRFWEFSPDAVLEANVGMSYTAGEVLVVDSFSFTEIATPSSDFRSSAGVMARYALSDTMTVGGGAHYRYSSYSLNESFSFRGLDTHRLALQAEANFLIQSVDLELHYAYNALLATSDFSNAVGDPMTLQSGGGHDIGAEVSFNVVQWDAVDLKLGANLRFSLLDADFGSQFGSMNLNESALHTGLWVGAKF